MDLSVTQGYFKMPKQPQTPLHIRKVAVDAKENDNQEYGTDPEQ
jgi:hypothetical protein